VQLEASPVSASLALLDLDPAAPSLAM
jgi:hypothetical protein